MGFPNSPTYYSSFLHYWDSLFRAARDELAGVEAKGPPFLNEQPAKSQNLQSLEILYLLVLLNGMLTCLFVIMGKHLTETYTNIMVTRKVGSYMLTIIMVSLICLFTIGEHKFVGVLLYAINTTILIFLVIYFGIMIARKL